MIAVFVAIKAWEKAVINEHMVALVFNIMPSRTICIEILYAIIDGGYFRMITKRPQKLILSNFETEWQVQRCEAKTRKGTACQKPPLRGKTRCRLHGGLSTGPKTPEGKARIAAAHWKHGRRSKAFTEARKQIWAELRAIEARMRADASQLTSHLKLVIVVSSAISASVNS